MALEYTAVTISDDQGRSIQTQFPTEQWEALFTDLEKVLEGSIGLKDQDE